MLFWCLNKLLWRKPDPTTSKPAQLYDSNLEEFTVESLWDDYERRTWRYEREKESIGSYSVRLLNWIGSIDQSGYTRERCLRWLITNRVTGDENRILLRLTDWVPQVQNLAKKWVLAHFRSLSFEEISSNQRLILYLSRKDRLQADESMHEIKCDLLRRTRTMTLRQFFSLSPMFRRFLFLFSLADDQHLRPLILDDPDPFNRLLILSELEFSEITSNEQRRLGNDKSIFVRERLFHARLEAGHIPDREELLALALDSTRSLRELGQFYLTKIFGENAYAIYKNLEGEAFFYIADYNRAEDAEHFLRGIRSGSRTTQYNCLRALTLAIPNRITELDISGLIVQSRKFRSVMLPVLPKLLSIEEILALRPAFEKSSTNGTSSFFRVLERKSFWAFVEEGLAVLLTDPGPALSEAIIRTISCKSSIYEALSSERRENISSLISKLREHDQKKIRKMADLLEFIMKTA